MKPAPLHEAFRSQELSHRPSRLVAILSFAILASGPLACGPIEPDAEPSFISRRQELETDNGLMANGLSANGLSANGFTSWFSQDPAQHDMVMRYIVRCAVPASQSRTYQDSQTQVSYTWQGGLGLAPGWSSGQPASLVEQQLVSACLAAHLNKFGVSVSISVLGMDATGQPIPVSDEEHKRYSRREGCFFGNLFNGEGLFFGVDGPRLHARESSSRACALSSHDPEVANECPPLGYAGRCDKLCERVKHDDFYELCTWQGVTYKALTTRVQKREIYECGDHICQISEKCSSGKNSGCEKDCGLCSSSNEE